jgi:protein PhnA
MNTEEALFKRSESSCELCTSNEKLTVYEVPPSGDPNPENCILLCKACLSQLEPGTPLDLHHWHCLKESMWSEVPAVKVVVWRLLKRLSAETWAQDLLDMLYLEVDTLAWANELDSEETVGSEEPESIVTSLDSNGAILQAGDTVSIIKDLVVKGAGFTAKRGTAVRNISLTDDPEQIEGRVKGTIIVILTKFLKKIT